MKKLISVYILVFMLCSLLIGCVNYKDITNGHDNENGNATPNNTEESAEPEETTDPAEENLKSNEQVIENNEQVIENNEQVIENNEQIPENNEEIMTESNENKEESPPPPPVGTAVGNLFRDVELDKIFGGTVNTEDLRGKIVILNVWATWCPPCRAELPDFSQIASDYSDDVVIIAAHTPSGRENALSYVETEFPETDIIFAYDTNSHDAFLAAGGTKYVPQTVILDRNGVIVYSDSGILSYAKLATIIESNK